MKDRFARVGGIRPNKLANGMMRTVERSKHKRVGGDVGALVVHGTNDELVYGNRFLVERTELACCPCCGAKRYGVRLNRTGKFRLQRLRTEREDHVTTTMSPIGVEPPQ